MSSPSPTPGSNPSKSALPPAYTLPTSAPPASSTAEKYGINYADPYDLGIPNDQNTSFGQQQVWYTSHSEAGTRAPDSEVQSYSDYKSVSDLLTSMLSLYSTNRATYDGVRGALKAAGYYGSTSLADITGRAAGDWDVSALKGALTDYLRFTSQTSVPTDFQNWLEGTGPDGQPLNTGGAQGGAAPQVQLTDPAQLQRYFNAAVSSSLGRNATTDELSKFVSSFHANETTQQTATGGPQTSTDPRSQALAQAHTIDPTGFQNHQTTGFMDAFYNMFLPNGSQLAQTPTDTNSISY